MPPLVHIGHLSYGKRQRMPGKKNPDRKTPWRAVDPDAWIPIAVPPILDDATFQTAQALAQCNQAQSKRNRKYEYPLVNGRLRCGQCGNVMAGHPDTRGVTRYRYTRPRRSGLVVTHSIRSVAARLIEPIVWHAVEDALNNPARMAVDLERRRAGTSTQQTDLEHERQQDQRQVAQCDKDLKRWEAAYLGEAIDLNDFKAKKAEVDARRASAERELTRLDDQQQRLEQTELETTPLMEYCARVRQGLLHVTLEEKRQALEALDILVTWHPEWPAPRIDATFPLVTATSSVN